MSNLKFGKSLSLGSTAKVASVATLHHKPEVAYEYLSKEFELLLVTRRSGFGRTCRAICRKDSLRPPFPTILC